MRKSENIVLEHSKFIKTPIIENLNINGNLPLLLSGPTNYSKDKILITISFYPLFPFLEAMTDF